MGVYTLRRGKVGLKVDPVLTIRGHGLHQCQSQHTYDGNLKRSHLCNANPSQENKALLKG